MCVQENYINHKPVIAKDEAMHMKVEHTLCMSASTCIQEILHLCERASSNPQDEGYFVSSLTCTGSGQGS